MESHYEILVIEVVQCQIGKLAKMDEEKDLELFISEYKQINGLLFNVIATKKYPDFIVHCSGGMKLGIEFAKMMCDPDSTFLALVFKWGGTSV